MTTRPTYRCPSINPMDADNRCSLPDDHGVEVDHEGIFKGRPVVWNYSPISVADNTPERWEVVQGSDRIEVAAKTLDAWGEAIRGNWGDVDGRSSRAQLSRVSAFLRGDRDQLTLLDVDVCDEGEGSPHWVSMGWDHKCSGDLL